MPSDLQIMYRHVNMLLEGMEKFENKNDLLKAFTTIPFSYVNPLLERHDDLQQLLQRITNVLNQFAAEQAEQQRKVVKHILPVLVYTPHSLETMARGLKRL